MIPKKFGYLGIANEAKPLGSEDHSTNIDHRHLGSGGRWSDIADSRGSAAIIHAPREGV